MRKVQLSEVQNFPRTKCLSQAKYIPCYVYLARKFLWDFMDDIVFEFANGTRINFAHYHLKSSIKYENHNH